MKWGAAFLVAGSCFAQPPLGGSWQGTLEVPGGGLRLRGDVLLPEQP